MSTAGSSSFMEGRFLQGDKSTGNQSRQEPKFLIDSSGWSPSVFSCSFYHQMLPQVEEVQEKHHKTTKKRGKFSPFVSA